MNNHKLFFLLKSLSPKELKNFRDFIYSPFFNKSKKIITLFDRLIKYYPDFEFVNITKEQLHYELFPKINYNDATLRHLFSDLGDLTEKFLVEVNFGKKIPERISCLLEELYLRNKTNPIGNHIKEMDEFYSVNEEFGSAVCLNRFKSETDKFNYFSLLPGSFTQKNILNIIEILNSRNKYLIIFFIIELIKCIDTVNLVSKKFNVNKNQNFTQDLILHLDIENILLYLINHKELREFSNILKTYYKLYKVFDNSDSEIFYFELKKCIKDNLDKFSFEETSYLYKKLVDLCIKKTKTNNSIADFDLELFSVYEDTLSMKLFLNKHTNTFPVDLFRNILILSLRLKKTEWAENFIYFYSDYLPSNQKMNLLNFSLAALSFEKSEYEKSLGYINKLNFNNISIKLDVKSLLLRIYFELNYDESLFSLCNSYRELIKRNDSIPCSKGNSHKEFINYIEKLMISKSSNDEIELCMLKKQIEDTNPLLNKRWLLEKADQLINQKESKNKFLNLA